MDFNISAMVERLFPFAFAETPVDVRLSQSRALTVEQVLGSLAELTRAGLVYSADGGVSNGIVPIATIPATAFVFALYNGNPKGGPSLVMLNAWSRLSSGATGLGYGLFGCVDTLEQTTIPTEYSAGGAINMAGHTGKNKQASKAIFAQAVTAAGVPAWRLLASEDKAAAAALGGGLWSDLKGSIIVPPGMCFGMQNVCVVGAGSPRFLNGCSWAEVQLQLD